MSAVHYDVAGIRAAGKKMHATANAQAMALAETDRDRTFVLAQDAYTDASVDLSCVGPELLNRGIPTELVASAHGVALGRLYHGALKTFLSDPIACNDFLRWFHTAAMNDADARGVGETVAFSPVEGGHA